MRARVLVQLLDAIPNSALRARDMIGTQMVVDFRLAEARLSRVYMRLFPCCMYSADPDDELTCTQLVWVAQGVGLQCLLSVHAMVQVGRAKEAKV